MILKLTFPGVRAQGPIAARRLNLGFATTAAWNGGLVDVAPYRGTRIAVTRRYAAILLDMDRTKIGRMLELGLLERAPPRPDRVGAFVLVDPAQSRRDVFDAYIADMTMPIHHVDFDRFEEIRAICGVANEERPPEPVLEGLFLRLLEIGCFSRYEAGAFLSYNSERWPKIKAWLNTRLTTFCARGPRRTAEVVTLKMFRCSLPPAIAAAPRTCFASGSKYDREPPSASARRRIWSLVRLSDCASLYALITAPRIRRPQQLMDHLKSIERIDDIMTTYAPDGKWTKDVYLAGMRAYAIDRDIRPGDRPAVRDLTLRIWRMVVHRLQMYVRQLPHAIAAGLRPFIPPLMRLSCGFRKELDELYGDLRPEGRAIRKQDSHDALNELDVILDAATNRRDEMRAFGEAARLEIDAMAPDERYRDFGVDVPVLDRRGSLASGQQKVWFRLWRTEAAWRSLPEVGPDNAQIAKPGALGEGTPPDRWPAHIVEHLRNEPIAGGETCDPWMVGIDRLGVTANTRSASPELRAARHDAIRSLALPGFQAMPAGLLNFDIWRARMKRAGLELGRHFIALEELEIGVRLAFHALDCVAQSFNRGQEVRQQRYRGWATVDPDKIGVPPVVDSGPMPKWHVQHTVPKAPKHLDLAQISPVPLTIREDALNEAMDVCELQVRLFGWDRFPEMPAAPDLAWKCGHADYVISCGGHALTGHQVGVLLRYLLIGWPAYTLHDFRHVMAEDAALDHLHPALIASLLGQRSVELAQYYSKLPAWAQDIVRQQDLRRRIKAQDQRTETHAAAAAIVPETSPEAEVHGR